MSYLLVLDLAADGIPVRLTCGVLGFSAQAFYQWRSEPVSEREWTDAHLVNAVRGSARHPTGDDLASARIDLSRAGWRLPALDTPIDLGTNVVALGYPLPDVLRDEDGGLTHLVSFRLMKGYLTHIPVVERAGFPPAASFELDMPAPEGLSGGPLLHGSERNVLLGVVYGTNEVARIVVREC